MSSFKSLLKTVYGPHTSSCYGKVLYVDPLLFPKKCPYNCIFCPLGRTVIKTIKPSIHVNIDQIISDLGEFFKENTVRLDRIIIWGFGDPTLNYQLPAIVKRIYGFIKKEKLDIPIVVKTSGVTLSEKWVLPLYELVEEVIIQLSVPGNLWRVYHDPVKDIRFNDLIKKISIIDKRYKKKLCIELVLFKLERFKNFDKEVILELKTAYKRMGIRKIYITTLDRPSIELKVKPVHGRILMKINKEFMDEGFKTIPCNVEEKKITKILVSSNQNKWLYNHISRFPLNITEIINIYGDQGISFLDQLNNKNIVEKIAWENRIYFKIKQQTLIAFR